MDGTEAERSSPYRASEQWVEGVQPVVHVLLVDGLQENASVFRAHGKGVGRLKEARTNICHLELLILSQKQEDAREEDAKSAAP